MSCDVSICGIRFLFFQIRTFVCPLTNCTIPYTPGGRFIHIPPAYPASDWANDFGRPWWRDDSYCIGILSQKTRFIKIINTLASKHHTLEVRLDNVFHHLQCLSHSCTYKSHSGLLVLLIFPSIVQYKCAKMVDL